MDWYAGTLYKALGVGTWSAVERRWAFAHLLVHDKEAGIVSAGSWEPVDLSAERGSSSRYTDYVSQSIRGAARRRIETPRLLIDARSGEYVRLIRPPAGAWTSVSSQRATTAVAS